MPLPTSLPRWPAIKLAAVALFVLATGGPTVIAGPGGRNDALDFWTSPQPREVQQTPGLVISRPRPHVVREPRIVHAPSRHRPVNPQRAVVPGAPYVPPVPAVDAPAVPGMSPAVPGLAPVVPVQLPGADGPANLPAAQPTQATPPVILPTVPPPVVATPIPAVPDKPVEINFFVSVLGDNLGQLLFQGLQESLADKPQAAVKRKARESTGLVRDDFYDWLKAAREMTGGQDRERMDFAVIMIGSNDRQPLRDGTVNVDVRSERWKELYGQRVEDLAAIFREHKIPLVWVGLPAMRSERLSADVLYFNEIYKERATKGGAIYVDTWEAFVDDKGQYSPYGPDVNGQNVKLRTGDGVHFTKAGALKLAHFAEGDIRRAIVGTKAPVETAVVPTSPPPAAPMAVVPVPAPPPTAAETPANMTALLNAQIKREKQNDPALSIQANLPPPDMPADITFLLRPPSGAVVSLTAPALAVGGQLATRGKHAPMLLGAEAQANLERALVEGRPMDAKPGRADDFAWPRR